MEEMVNKLKEKLETYDTRDLLGMISIRFMTFANDGEEVAFQSDIFNKTNLMSPQKQYLYLAGLLMSTTDLSKGISHDSESEFIGIEKDIQAITSKYILGFMDLDEETIKNDPEKAKKHFVSAEAFSSYFDMGILRYDEQTLSLIKDLYSPFDIELETLTSLCVSDYIDFYHFISSAFEESFKACQKVQVEIFDFLDTLDPRSPNINNKYKKLLEFVRGNKRNEFQSKINGVNIICTTDIVAEFGEVKGNALINAFSLQRQERDFTYYNGKNPFAKQPLCYVDESQLFVIHPKFLLNAIFDYITDILENPQNTFAAKYKKSKADIVENFFLTHLKSLLGEKAIYHSQVCEERGTKEHDILVEFDKYILVAEVKASKVREPFFNPEKAYQRIYDHFHSDSGIGGAYKQAIILKELIEKNQSITLFENKSQAFTISNISQKIILPIVLTLNQFGSIAVNTSQLIQTEDNQPYPWVCNLHDMENIIEINTYLNKGPSNFIDYILWRINNHAHIYSSDELDVLENYYLNNKATIKITNSDTIIMPNGPSLIDKIYFEKHGIPYTLPAMEKKPVRRTKVGRNELCPCGSGIKFKKCCIRKGIYD